MSLNETQGFSHVRMVVLKFFWLEAVFIPAPHQRSSIPTDRQANRAGGEKECYKFLLPKIFATLHFRAL